MSDDGTGRSEGSSEEATDLTHTDEEGSVDMVDVGSKPDTTRRAVARGRIRLQPATVDAIRQNAGAKSENVNEENENEENENEVRRGENDVEKGDVLATARIGAIQAVKHTWETIPLCHQIPITNVETAFEFGASSVTLTVAVETTGKTGCEMEALEGVTTGLNVVWDMVKAAEKDADGQYPGTRIENVEVVRKEKSELGSD